MGYPAYSDHSTIDQASSTSAISVDYPVTVNADDILFLLLWNTASSVATFNTPAGFTVIDTQTDSGYYIRIYYKRATGAESGSLAITGSWTSTSTFGNMTTFSGAIASGTPYDNSASNVGTTTSPTTAVLNADGYERLAAGFVHSKQATTAISGFSDYSEEYQLSDASGGKLSCITQQVLIPETVDAEVLSTSPTSNDWSTFIHTLMETVATGHNVQGTWFL